MASTQTRTESSIGPLKDNADPAPQGSTGALNSSMRCPDPSAHQTKSTALQDQASTAALYAHNPAARPGMRDPLGPDGKLSAASAATSLKHARPQDLPSFPIVGIDLQSSAGTAALLANANKKSPEWWKPEPSAAAGKAALLANDFKMDPLWQPEASMAGSKAALLAHKDSAKVTSWTPEASAYGNSAALIAMDRKGASPGVLSGDTATEERRKKALVAATGAFSASGRKRAQSTPAPSYLFPDSANSAKNALNAATLAHSPSVRVPKSPVMPTPSDSNRLGSGAMEAARIQHSKSISREMYTERPPVAIEVEEKKRQDALRASAISMAKKMYDVQQQQIEHAGQDPRSQAQTGATTAQGQQSVNDETRLKEQAMRYIGIQEAAQKLAAERLAKIGMDDNAASAYRSYYGYEKPTRSKLSIRRGRNRASSNPEPVDSDDDELRSRRIRSQMSQFNKSLAEVDAKKREKDRKYLIAAAERKVQAQMLGLDKKIFDETGKMSPAMIDEWDAKARAKATANSEMRMEHHGRVHIGQGRYMDQADIDAVALARIQPTLDDITEKTEKRRAQDEERRLELEEQKRQARIEKERAAEIKAEEKRGKEEEKKVARARTGEEKSAAKQLKEAEKEKRAEEKRLAKEEKRKSKEAGKPADPVDTVDSRPSNEGDNHKTSSEHESSSNPTSPTSPTSSKGLKGFLNKLKRRSKHSTSTAEPEKPSFVGGAALRSSNHSASQPESGRNSAPASPRPGPIQTSTSDRRHSDVSSISGSSDYETPGPIVRGRTTSGLSADFDEARDTFDEKLAPPPSFTSAADTSGRMSPSRDSKFKEMGL